jgi:chromosome segregation ATPase
VRFRFPIIFTVRQPGIERALEAIFKELSYMSEQIDNLEAGQHAIEASVDQAIAELKELHDDLQGAIDSGDMARVQAVADALRAKTDVLNTAIADNAPPAPVTP